MTEPRSIYPKHFLQEHFLQNPHPDRKTGFILIPFKDEFKPVEKAIRAAIATAGLTPYRADDPELFNTRATMEAILRGIADAQVVVADMTGKNENVFYEAGIAHTTKHNVVLLTQDTERLSFDSQHIPHIRYKLDNLEGLTQDLSGIIGRLPPEPPPERRGTGDPASPTEMKNALRRQLEACEREWTDDVVPAESKKFRERLAALQKMPTSSSPDEEWEESLRIHLPAFLPPWLQVEDLGFEVIREGPAQESVMPELMVALESAFTLWERITPQQPNTITTHSSLLALRTWTLWGAAALDYENWGVVEALLNRPTNIGPNHPSLAQLHHLHYPAAAGGLIHIAARSVEEQPSAFAAQHFGNPESMQAFIGFWRFAADLAAKASDQWMLQTWATAPRARFEGLVNRLGTDAEYAGHFATAVLQKDVASVNEEWESDLRDELTSRKRRGSGLRHWMLPHLPARFAE